MEPLVEFRAQGNKGQSAQQASKRKHSSVEGGGIDDAVSLGHDGGDGGDDTARRKRTKSGILALADAIETAKVTLARDGKVQAQTRQQETPPIIARRRSGAPIQGVELEIPSRPATPIPVREGSGVSSVVTNNSGSRLVQKAVASSRQATASLATAIIFGGAKDSDREEGKTSVVLREAGEAPPPTVAVDTDSGGIGGGDNAANAEADVDEDLWAAFQSEVIDTPPLPKPGDNDATATEKSNGDLGGNGSPSRRSRAAAEAIAQDEREEASRALETEFEVMAELENRVKKLKEKREALRRAQPDRRRDGQQNAGKGAVDPEAGSDQDGKDDDEAEDDESEDALNDDWEGFRFKP